MRASTLLAIALPVWACMASPAAEPEPAMEVVLVAGDQPGPALWKITSGERALWLLGEVAPLPRKVKWRSKQFETLLAESQEVILHDSSHMFRGRQAREMANARKLPDERKLSEVVSPALRERVSTVAKIYGVDGPLEELSPSVIGTRLANASLMTLELRAVSLQVSVHSLARRSKVKVTYYSVPHSDVPFEEQLRMIKDDALATCPLERVIDVLEDGGAGLRRLANAWSTGDIDALRRLVPKYGLFTPGFRSSGCSIEGHASQPLTKSRVNQRTEAWLQEVERALRDNRVTLAVVPIPELFAADGYLAALRTRGYQVQEPE